MCLGCAGMLSCSPPGPGQAAFPALQVLYDIGAVSTPEPFHRLVSQVRSAGHHSCMLCVPSAEAATSLMVKLRLKRECLALVTRINANICCRACDSVREGAAHLALRLAAWQGACAIAPTHETLECGAESAGLPRPAVPCLCADSVAFPGVALHTPSLPSGYLAG